MSDQQAIDEPDDRYLWDGTGPADPEVARLESVLAPLRYSGTAPLSVPRPAAPKRRLALRLAAAAAVVIAVTGAAWLTFSARAGWAVQRLTGLPRIDGSALDGLGRLRRGQWLMTDGAAQARVSVGHIGDVVVAPNSRVQLLQSGGREHRLALERGTIHARIWAPPRFFFVNTPSAVAVDLGCAYTLQVDDRGRGLLRVTAGWVALEHEGRQSFIPQGAMCLTMPGAGPGTPRYDDAPSGYATALATLDFGGLENPLRPEALDLVLTTARRRDALTLWHLLVRGTPAERARVYERLDALAPPPSGVTREAVLAGDRHALDRWWDALGINNGAWWLFWKKKAAIGR
jgi:hypothetical protein